jgi:hypothetical protein
VVAASTSLDQILREAESARKKPKPDGISAAVLADPRAALGTYHCIAFNN